MRWVIVLFSFVLCPLPVAADFQWQASTFVASEHSNNIRLEPEGEGSDTRTDVGVALGFEASHSRYTLNAGYDLRREYFRKDTFDESNTIEGTMSLEALLLPRRLRWFIDHSQENTRIDSRLRDTPDNREERSILSTGPELYLYPSRRDTVTLSSTYTKVDLEENRENNSERASVSASWARLVSRSSRFGLNAVSDRVKFPDREEFNYDRHSLTLSLSGQTTIFDFSVGLGANQIDPENGESQDGAFVRAEFSKSYAGADYTLDVNRELTDTVYGDGEIDPVGGISNIADSREEVGIIERTAIGVGALVPAFNGRLNGTYRLVYGRDKGLEDVETDQTSYQLIFDLRFELNEEVEPFLVLQGSRVKYDEQVQREDDNLRAEIGLSYRPSPRAEFALGLAQEENTSSQDQNDYDELSANLSFTYLFGSQY